MKIEYLFTDKKDRSHIEAYELPKGKVEKAFFDIENADCWTLSLETAGDSMEDAALLSDIHDRILREYHPIEITNDSSAYYNQMLFPLFNAFEWKLRKLLYLKSALNQAGVNIANIADLHEQDLGSIFELLFTDTNFINSAKQQINEKNWKYTKDEILKSLNEIPENVLWDSLIGSDCVPTLRKSFFEVRRFRNDVMHAHSMNTASFQKADGLIRRVNAELDFEIQNAIGRMEKLVQTELDRGFNSGLSAALNLLKKRRQWEEYEKIKQEFNERITAMNAHIQERIGNR